jgi:two-component system, NarL family, nitrate/nitrite sensor histidine kinase NarX
MFKFQRTSLFSKLVGIGVVLLVVALTSIGLTLWVTWQLEGGAAFVNEAGRMRMQTWRTASEIQAGISQEQRLVRITEFDQNLRVLQSGDPSRPLFVPWDPVVRSKFAAVQAVWVSQRSAWVSGAAAQSGTIVQSTSELVATIDALVSAIEHQLAKLTAVLNLSQFIIIALAIVAAIVMLYTGFCM